MSITLDGTTGIIADSPATVKANAFLDAAGGNTATVNGTLIPASGVTLVSTAATQTLTNKSIAASQLPGALPAIDGSALTGIATGGMTLLGTMATTSGTTVTLSGLTLTSYNQLLFDFNNVSHNSGTANYVIGASNFIQSVASASNFIYGNVWVSLTSGVFYPLLTRNLGSAPDVTNTRFSAHGYTTASTSVSISTSSGAFYAGSVKIYGMK